MRDRQKTRSKMHREDGAAAVEFALIVGLLAMLVFGMMEYGLAFWQLQSLRAATREGARVAAVGGDTSQVTNAVVDASSGALPAGFGGISVSGGGCPEPSAGTPIDQSVTVSINNAALPSNIQEILTIDIPLLPSIALDPDDRRDVPMRAGLIARIRDARLRSGEESGAVVVIVVLSLIAIFAMLVLTVDVGGLLLARRAMVNASDSAALAAAQSCASAEDTLDPEAVADTYAADNVDGVLTGTSNITEIVGCDDGNGHVSVEYLTQQNLFFAGVLGFGSTGDVSTQATAAWGPAAGGYAVPIVLESGYLQGICKIPDGVSIGDTCAMYYNNGDASLGDANWGFMNLDMWNVDAGENCHNAG